jgi:hypothetical protein
MPSLSDIKSLVDNVFVASLRREEDRPLRIGVCLISSETVEKNNAKRSVDGLREAQIVQRFETSLPLSADVLVKLAPAFEPSSSAILIEPSTTNNDPPRIWGAMHFGKQGLPDLKYSATTKFTLLLPDALLCTALSPGSLVISRGLDQIGSIVLGEFIRPDSSPFLEMALGQYLIGLLSAHRTNADAKKIFFDMYFWVLIRLLSEVSWRGHGSTIMIIPHEKQNESTKYYESNFSFKANFRMEECLTEAMRDREFPDTHLAAYYLRDLWNRVSAVAQLGSIDGALLLSPEFEPLSFGTKLRAPKWLGRVLTGPTRTSFGGSAIDITKYGTRHNSALDFVGAVEGAIGFVVSTDGPVRGFVRKGPSTIQCWPDCRQYVHAWHAGVGHP